MEQGSARLARLERIYHRSSSLSPAEREALLFWECGEDPELHALAQQLLRGKLKARSDAETAAAIEVQGFRVIEELGRGSMGAVYLAEETALGRRVALKVLHGNGAGERELARFRREVRALARLDHPGVARVLGSGVQATSFGPRPWFAMSLVQGRRLTEAARDLSLPSLALLGASLADALQAAHSAGVVHRDLKPANVLVDARGHPVVLDFGVAALQGDARADSLRTEPGSLLGTLATMSPEQTRDAAVDGRADVYALGAMLYELATGRAAVPVDGCDLAEALRRIREDEPPSARRAAGVPRDLSTILATALEKEPGRRYASAADLAEDLRRFADHRPIRARPTPLLRRLAQGVRRNRAAWASVGAVVLALGAGLAATSIALGRARRAEAEALGARAVTERQHDALLAVELRERLSDLWPADAAALAQLEQWIDLGEDLRQRLPAHREFQASAPADEVRFAREGLRVAEDLFAPQAGEPGFANLVARRDLVRNMHALSIDAHRGSWDEATAAIADPARCPAYGGLELVPQLGLVPLGPDPQSNLWEFACLGAAGEPAQRDAATGRVRPLPWCGLVMVLIPGGEYELGHQKDDPAAPLYDPNARTHERPVRVRLDPFFVSKFEVTQGQWTRVMGSNPSYWAPGDDVDGWFVTELHPVETVDWDDATHFAERLGLLLPTEAQFEAAQRGGTATRWWTGDAPESLEGAEAVGAHAPQGRSAEEKLFLHALRTDLHAPVGSFRPNAFGLYDVSGNVNEWCRDVFWVNAELAPPRPGDGLRARPDPRDNAENPHRSRRGGGHGDADLVLASGFRDDDVRAAANRSLGFRVMRPVDRTERDAAHPDGDG